MNNRIIILAPLSAVIIAISCGQQEENVPPAQINADTTLKIRVEDTISDATLTSRNTGIKQLTFTQLLQYMPEDLSGFSIADPINGEDGAIGKSGSRYFSFASKTFSKKDEKVRIEIIDYSPDTAQYQGLLNMYGFNSPVDNNVLITKQIDLNIPSAKAVATEYKTENTAKVIVGVAGRVLVVITGMQTKDLGFLQKVARKINYKKMVDDAGKNA